MKKMKYISAILATVLLTAGCGFLDVEPKVIVADTYYTSETEVYYGLVGVYGVMNNESFYGLRYSLFLSNTDDLCYFNRSTTTNYTTWYSHDASSSEIYEAWTIIYEGIKNANSFMEAIADSEYDEEHKYYNEARFLRAYYHFLLAEAWGDVPLRDKAPTSPSDVNCPATPQYDVLKWVAEEMEACLDLADESWQSPSRVNKTIMWGILARVYLFMAGESISGNEAYRQSYYEKAMDYSYYVIRSGQHELNPSYEQVFINMISDQYDTQYRESMWEVDFMGDRSSSDKWTNGRIGDMIGLQSSPDSDYDKVSCNYAYGQFDGSLKLWNLYWSDDRVSEEYQLTSVTDARQEWNMCPYNYNGSSSYPPYPQLGSSGSGSCAAGIDKTPYTYNMQSTSNYPTTARAIRNCGKWRREVEYEGVIGFKGLYTQINYPLLRYSDVLLMYAEAYNEFYQGPTQEIYNYVKMVRDRAGIQTRDYAEYSNYYEFQEFVRNERGRELCFEGLRKFDLIRWGIFVKNMRSSYVTDVKDAEWASNSKAGYAAHIGSNIQDKHIVYPIPAIELGVNSELKQNPLW